MRTSTRGLTYVEMIVWIGVFTAAMIALGTSLVYFYRTSHYSIGQSSAVASVQRAMDTMVRTIREASYASDGAYPIASLGVNEIVFYAHTNPQSPYAQKIRFFVAGNTLMQGSIEPSGDPPTYSGTEVVSELADYVQNITIATTTFSYYDENGTLMTDLSRIGAVRFIRTTVHVDVNVNDQPARLMLQSSTALRNLIEH